MQATISAFLPLKIGDKVGVYCWEGKLNQDAEEGFQTQFYGILYNSIAWIIYYFPCITNVGITGLDKKKFSVLKYFNKYVSWIL